jgi:asparagine synthase (glutamine-hydrolysing)
MCGICGVALSSRSTARVDVGLIERMRDVLQHRGPDGAGIFIEEGIALGHRRLSIVDVAHGQQPMASEDGTLQIVYNGEVFNHPSLSEELRRNGVQYRTHCDTETVLHVFERERERTPKYLRGMFAFAVWDRRRRELFLARDRFGVKPLYYALSTDGSLYFGSEIKSVLAAGVMAPRLNLAELPDYLANHATSGENTLFEGVKRLLPGHTLRWRDGEVRIARYWDLSFAPDDSIAARSDEDLVQEYGERLLEAVRLRLMADVPLGCFLSGGIDSAAITALMTRLVGGGVKTFSVAFAEREANELAYAQVVARAFRTEHHQVVVTPADFFSSLPRLVWHEDEPLAHPSSVPLNFVSRLAAQHVKVVLTGEGSDETLGGYGRYRSTAYQMAAGRLWEHAGGAHLRGALQFGIDHLPGGRFRQRLRRTFLYLPADLLTLYFDNFAVFSRARQANLLSTATLAQLGEVRPYEAVQAQLEQSDAVGLLDRLLYADTKTYLHELLMKQDQMSMAASIESRVPFLDHPLVEFAAKLPRRLKLRGFTTKYALRRAMRGVLPAEILNRPKMGFPVPIGSWLRGRYRPLLDEYVLGPRAVRRDLFNTEYLRRIVAEHGRGTENHSERLWALINLELWHRLFIDGEDISSAIRVIERIAGSPLAAPGVAGSNTQTLTALGA